LESIETPFIAQFGSEFVVVRQVNDDSVSIVRYGKEISVPLKFSSPTQQRTRPVAYPAGNQ
jgi:hypothetical protein